MAGGAHVTPYLNRQEIQRRVDELGPWVHAFEFDGVRYFDSGERPVYLADQATPRSRRTQPFYDVFPGARRILELGALEAADTVALAGRPGTEVVAIEGRAENLRRAEFVVELHGLTNVRFVLGDVEADDLSALGRFDAVVCSGILYHVQRPWELLAAIAAVTDNVFIWTHYWGDLSTTVDRGGYQVKVVQEQFVEPRLRGLSPVSLWFTESSLFQALADNGFTDVETVAEAGDGPIREITVAARK
jgi:hypothetical protein